VSAERRNDQNPKPATARVFFALWPSPAVAGQLGKIADATAVTSGGRATRPDTIHLTLAFLGNVPEARLPTLAQAAAEVWGDPFTLDIDRLGFWAHNHLVWAGSSAPHPALAPLQSRLQRTLLAAGFHVGGAARAFVPHVTLVRHVPAAVDHPALPAIASCAWSNERFVLVRSTLSAQGSSYRIIDEFPLTGAA